MAPLARLAHIVLALLLVLPSAQVHACAPAASMMHDMAMPGMTGHGMPHHPMPAPTAHHDCLGCIAPIDIAVYRPVRLARAIAMRTAPPTDSPFFLTPVARPDPPPPRPIV